MSSAANPASLAEIVRRHELFFVDQFGVLHDGTTAYPGAIDALGRIMAAGKTVVLLSNSGKRAAANIKRLNRLGFTPDLFSAFVSSGEVAWHLLRRDLDSGTMTTGARCLLLARDDDRSAIEGLGFSETATGADADVILLSGSQGDRMAMDEYRAILEPAARRGVPCLCTNPDKIMLTPTGPHFGAGAIADAYEAMGGAVRWIGKPYPEMYHYALEVVQAEPTPAVCCIGDSVEHDIAGGAGIGLSTALVRSGILAEMTDHALDGLLRQHAVRPDYIIDRFSFGDMQ